MAIINRFGPDRYSLFKILASFVALLLFQSCYEPKGNFFVPVSKPPPEGIEVNLADVGDMLYVYKPTSFSYITQQGDYTLVKIEGLLDGTSLFDPDNPTKILLDPKKFREGNHILKIEATFLSHSGTLASQIGQEYETLSKEYDLVIDLTAPQSVKIKKFTVKDGTFFVTWEAPQKNNFTNYRLRRFFKSYDGQWSEYSNPPLLSGNVQVFKDSLFRGGNILYRVDLVGYTFEVSGIPSDTTVAPTAVTVKQTGDNTMELAWTKSPLYANISNILLKTPGSDLRTPYPGNEPAILPLTVLFGEVSDYSAVSTSPYAEQWGFFDAKVYLGKRLEYKGLGETIVEAPEMFGSQEILIDVNTPKEVYLVDSKTLVIERKIDLSGYLTNMGNTKAAYGYTPDGNKFYLFVSENIYAFDKDFNFIEAINIPGVTASVFYSRIKVSNVGIATLATAQGTVVVNLETRAIIRSHIPEDDFYVNVSPDGAYYTQKGDVYAITGNTATYVATIPKASTIGKLFFKPTGHEALVSYQNGSVGVYDLSSQSMTALFDVPEYRVVGLSYDPVTGLCGAVNSVGVDREYFVFDMNTKTIHRTLKVAGYDYQLYNNTIYAIVNGLAFPL